MRNRKPMYGLSLSHEALRPWLTDAGGHHSLVVVGVDTHVVTLEVKGILAAFDVLQFILVQVRPPPQPRVDNVGEAFAPGYLCTERKERKN